MSLSAKDSPSPPSSPDDHQIDQTGQCLCGNVKFRVKGTIVFNELCHCRGCGRARGMTPVHVLGVQGEFDLLQGDTRTIAGMGSMEHVNCATCGGGLYQRPAGETFYAVFPTTFQIETVTSDNDVPSSLLPAYLQPTVHVNYENRLMDFHDNLPKYKSNFGSRRVNNAGEIID